MISTSVVIPCFRCADTLARTVESLKRQTAAPEEVIFVDDASGDGIDAELERQAVRLGGWTRAHVMRLASNRGPSGARNAGWDAARAAYVAFLDADATWHPRKLELQHLFMECHPEVAISGYLRAVGANVALQSDAQNEVRVTYLGFGELLWSNPIAPSSMMVRREIPLRFPEEMRRMEDQRFLLDLTRAGHKLAVLRAPLAAHHKPDFGCRRPERRSRRHGKGRVRKLPRPLARKSAWHTPAHHTLRLVGAIRTDQHQRIIEFVEKGSSAGPGALYTNAGIYVMTSAAIAAAKDKVPSSLEFDVFPLLAAAGRCFVFCAERPLVDIGTPERLKAANDLLG